eukprot:g48975.t1
MKRSALLFEPKLVSHRDDYVNQRSYWAIMRDIQKECTVSYSEQISSFSLQDIIRKYRKHRLKPLGKLSFEIDASRIVMLQLYWKAEIKNECAREFIQSARLNSRDPLWEPCVPGYRRRALHTPYIDAKLGQVIGLDPGLAPSPAQGRQETVRRQNDALDSLGEVAACTVACEFGPWKGRVVFARPTDFGRKVRHGA